MKTKKRVFITRKILEDGPIILEKNGIEVDIFENDHPIDRQTLLDRSKNVDAIITMLTDPIDEPFLTNVSSNLKIIANYAVGFNNINLEIASQKNIYVCNTPDVLTEATAEVALGLMISVARNFHQSNISLMNNQFSSFNPKGYLGIGLTGKTLGIIGLGRIGLKLAEMASSAFGMKILYTSKTDKNNDYQKSDLENLLINSDFVSIHAPLNKETFHLISKKELKLMKKTSILINTARGDLVNQKDLYEALLNNEIWGAGLDVTSPEPLPHDHPLKLLPNCYLLPHIGSANIETRTKMSIMCAESIVSLFNGIECDNIVNKYLLK
jgi:glyoxylate reductase